MEKRVAYAAWLEINACAMCVRPPLAAAEAASARWTSARVCGSAHRLCATAHREAVAYEVGCGTVDVHRAPDPYSLHSLKWEDWSETTL